jgi:hypothetical protein
MAFIDLAVPLPTSPTRQVSNTVLYSRIVHRVAILSFNILTKSAMLSTKTKSKDTQKQPKQHPQKKEQQFLSGPNQRQNHSTH